MRTWNQDARRGPGGAWIIVALILVLCALRLIHLEADTPLDMAHTYESGDLSVGVYVDEGYKTLDARNLYLYGTPKWDPRDNFHGWMKLSPLTQWAFYLAFNVLGESLAAARIVTIVSFFVLLLAYTLGTVRKYPAWLFLIGLVLLGVLHHLFLFSRIAIFVLPIAASLYALLFFLGREGMAERPVSTLLALVAVSILATFGIKMSAPLYFAPVVLAVVLTFWFGRRRSASTTIAVIVGAVLAGGGTLTATHAIWWSRLENVSTAKLFSSLLDNGMSPSSGVMVCLGLVCAFHVLLTRSRPILGSPYGASLVAIVILGPALVSIFPYHPLRYYVPLLPAFLLLALEWIHVRAWESPIPERSTWLTTGLCLAILTVALLNLARAVNHQVLANLPFSPGSEPGLSAASIYRYVVPMAAATAVALWIVRRRVFAGRLVVALVIALAVVSTLRDLYVDGRFLLYPSYRSREIAAEIRRLVPEGAVVGGDWAPFFTLGSGIRALYMNERFNRGERIRQIRPDYFLFSDTDDGEAVRNDLERIEGVTLGSAILRSSYVGREVVLYPLTYAD